MTTTDMRVAIDWGTAVTIPAFPAPRVITWSFVAANLTPEDTGHSAAGVMTSAFIPAEQQAVRDALAMYERVLNVHFQEDTVNPGTLRFAMLDLQDVDEQAFAKAPGTTAAGFLALDPLIMGERTPGNIAGAGSDFFEVLTHEIGHLLGLAHPHDTGGTSDIYSGVTGDFIRGDFNLNQRINTIMSYNRGWENAPGGATGMQNFGYAAGPMAFDIAVLQAKYGARVENIEGRTYSLSDANAAGDAFTCIYQFAGQNNTIAYTGNQDSVINLKGTSNNDVFGT